MTEHLMGQLELSQRLTPSDDPFEEDGFVALLEAGAFHSLAVHEMPTASDLSVRARERLKANQVKSGTPEEESQL